MSKYAFYDAANDVIHVNVGDIQGGSTVLVDQIVGEVHRLLDGLDHRVFLVSCWKDTAIAPEVAEHYGRLVTLILPRILGVVRWGNTNLYTRTAIRTQAVVNHWDGSHLYATLEEALDAVRRLRRQDAET